MTPFDDETLMAFADGRLDDETSAKVEAALGDDPAVAERVAALAESGRLVRDLHRPLADLPVPPELLAKVRALAERSATPDGEVVDFASRRERRSVRSIAWPMAMAASIAALVAAPIGYLLAGGGVAPSPTLAFSEDVSPALAGALDTLPSGSETTVADAGLVRAIATFRDAEGQLCREFEVDTDHAMVAVACRSGEAWRIAFAVEAPLSGGFAPASSLAALDAYLDAVSAGQPLSAEEEAEVLAGGT